MRSVVSSVVTNLGRRSLHVALVAAMSVWLGGGSVGVAQSGDGGVERTAAARALFEEGMHAVDARDWATAADQLGRSLALRPSLVVRFNLALALVELGRFVEAGEHLRTVQREAPEDADVRTLAAERLEQVLARVGRLRIDVSGPLEGREIRLDDVPVPSALLGVAQPANPGPHRVRALRRSDQSELASAEVRVESGALASVALSLPEPPRAGPAAPASSTEPAPAQPAVDPRPLDGPPSAPSPSPDPGGIEREAWFWTLVGVFTVGVGVAVGVGVLTTQPAPPDYIRGDGGSTFTTLLELPLEAP